MNLNIQTNIYIHINKQINMYINKHTYKQTNIKKNRGRRVLCGRVTDKTKIVFRSGSANFYIMIQVSKELWETDTKGNILYEKVCMSII